MNIKNVCDLHLNMPCEIISAANDEVPASIVFIRLADLVNIYGSIEYLTL